MRSAHDVEELRALLAVMDEESIGLPSPCRKHVMKVQQLYDALPQGRLVRLFAFTPAEAERLRQAVRALGDGARDRVDLAADLGIVSVDGVPWCFVAGRRDRGLVQEQGGVVWMLRRESSDNVEGLMEPFTNESAAEGQYQWLSEVSGDVLLLSVDGTW